MAGPKSGILSDPLPYQLPEIEKQSAPRAVAKSDWARLGASRKYKQVYQHIEIRKEYWRHFLPGGEELKKLAITDPESAGRWAAVASCIIDELDQLQFRIQRESGK